MAIFLVIFALVLSILPNLGICIFRRKDKTPGRTINLIWVVLKRNEPTCFEGDKAFFSYDDAARFKDSFIDFEKYEVRTLGIAMSLLTIQASASTSTD